MICSIFHGSNTIQEWCLAHVEQYNTIQWLEINTVTFFEKN